jgi:hypothetical protein
MTNRSRRYPGRGAVVSPPDLTKNKEQRTKNKEQRTKNKDARYNGYQLRPITINIKQAEAPESDPT